MPPIPPNTKPLPRIVIYYQTHHDPSGQHISILPLVTQPGISVTHVILAAIHLNEDPQAITLNDDLPSHPRCQPVWAELRVLQASGVRVMGMLGGAAKGSYARLDGSQDRFELYYAPLRDLVQQRGLDGLDLDVEERMSLVGVVRLIDRLRKDFGADFIISMAPVAAALLDYTKNLSGFDYEALEVMRGEDIAWYNAQFYWGWGDFSTTIMYDAIIRKGWPPEKVVAGVVTSPENARGYVPMELLGLVLRTLQDRYVKFGGVMGWEFFNSKPAGRERPWEWAQEMTRSLRRLVAQAEGVPGVTVETKGAIEIDPDTQEEKVIAVPARFEYYSDENDD